MNDTHESLQELNEFSGGMGEEPKIAQNNPAQSNYLDSKLSDNLTAEQIFKPEVIARPCSENMCERGHSWQPKLQIVQCRGCGSPILAVKMEQCPLCNEPVKHFRLRSDHLSSGVQIMPMCRGASTHAEVVEIMLDRHHATETENSCPKPSQV